MDLLEFSFENAKLANTVIFSLPAGHCCPFAVKCKSMADRKTGRKTGRRRRWRSPRHFRWSWIAATRTNRKRSTSVSAATGFVVG